MAQKIPTLNFEQTLMYGQYREDLARFARSIRNRNKSKDFIKQHRKTLLRSSWFQSIFGYFRIIWRLTFGRIGEDWPFLTLLGILMAILSFIIDFFIGQCHQTRILLYERLLTYNLFTQYLGWILIPILLLMFAAGMVSIVSPQAVGSGIPEMKTILRGVILYEYLSFRTLIAKLIGLVCSLGSGLPLGKEGPFVHVASMVATRLSKMIGSFEGVYDKDSRMVEMLAAACAVGVATTFYAPIGGVLFSVEVTTDFFAVRNYWRGFFAACCAATVWRLFAVWFRKEAALTSLFKTNFRTDFPFDPQELLIFALIGIVCGLGGAAYVRSHRFVVHYIRNQKKLNSFLKKSRFIYPGLITLILMSVSFPPFLGQFMASILSNPQTFQELFSNITWDQSNTNDSNHLLMIKHWSTSYTSIYFNLIICIINTFWMSILASTIPVPSGLFVPIFKIGAAFGRLIGEIMARLFPNGIPFSGYQIPIVPGGYAVVGAAAFTGAVTHTISITVIIFEMTGQMSHMIPVILSVLISNAISQKLELSIYDSVIQIKKLPFLPPLMGGNILAHNIFVDNIMIKQVKYCWRKKFSYNDLNKLLIENPSIRTFPLVDNKKNMILLGSIQREELLRLLDLLLSRNRRLNELRHYDSYGNLILDDSINSIDDEDLSPSPLTPTKNKSRFEVSLVNLNNEFDSNYGQKQQDDDDATINKKEKLPKKSILKQTITVSTYTPNTTINQNMATIHKDSRLRQVFEDIFQKSLKLQDANPNNESNKQLYLNENFNKNNSKKHVKLPRERIIDMTMEQQKKWEKEQLNLYVDFNNCLIDPAPFQLVERTTIYKVHLLFSMLGLSQAYVTSTGKLVGVLALKDLRIGIEKLNQGLLKPQENSENYLSKFLDRIDDDDDDDNDNQDTFTTGLLTESTSGDGDGDDATNSIKSD